MLCKCFIESTNGYNSACPNLNPKSLFHNHSGSAFHTSQIPKASVFFERLGSKSVAMEVGKRLEEEAGPSSAGKIDELRQETPPQTAEESEVDYDDKEGFTPGPLLSLKEQIEKDKDDESLRRWKEKLLGCLESDLSEQREPEVKFNSIGIISDEFGEINTPLPVNESQGGRVLFTLREGSRYQLRLTFTVMHNIVSGLSYSNKVWREGLLVDRTQGMLGTFAPQREPYVETLDEETTPSGVLARGIYSAKLKFEDDDKRCYMELQYSFEIKKSN